VKVHPILGPQKVGEIVEFSYNGENMKAYRGDSVASALIANGVIMFRKTKKKGDPRGYFCGIGLCTDCMMKVNGVRNVRTCITEIEDNMVIETQ
jgi:predicted molibdopterin-dependent oxidoreductase YjgC